MEKQLSYFALFISLLLHSTFGGATDSSMMSAEEFVIYSMEHRGITNDVYKLIFTRLTRESVKQENSLYGSILHMFVEDVDRDHIDQFLNNNLDNAELEDAEWRNIALLFITTYSDFKYAARVDFDKNNVYIRDYIYQPLLKDELPRDSQYWEEIIYRACVSEMERCHKSWLETGTCRISDPYLYMTWLAKYGRSEKVQRFLVELPFDRKGLIYSKRSSEIKSGLKARCGISEDLDGWLEFYIEYVIEPAGLANRFLNEAHKMKNYTYELEKSARLAQTEKLEKLNKE